MNKWIKEKQYCFDLADITTIINVIATMLTIAGYWWATIIFIVNCAINTIYTLVKVKRINVLILNLSLIVLNGYFLIGDNKL